jgi:DNA-binding CsgD family transcriptional regulator
VPGGVQELSPGGGQGQLVAAAAGAFSVPAQQPGTRCTVLHPVPGLLERRAGHGTDHAALIAEILSLLAGRTPAGREPPLEPVSDSEMRVLRYLPTDLTAPEIARELYVSRDTVKTHMRSLYAKFGTHSRADTVDRARALGQLAALRAQGPSRAGGLTRLRHCRHQRPRLGRPGAGPVRPQGDRLVGHGLGPGSVSALSEIVSKSVSSFYWTSTTKSGLLLLQLGLVPFQLGDPRVPQIGRRAPDRLLRPGQRPGAPR